MTRSPSTPQTWRTPTAIPKFARLVARGLVDLFFPPNCAYCGGQVGGELALCSPCETALLAGMKYEYCSRCGMRLGPYAGDQGRCAYCHEERFAFDQVLHLGEYGGDLAHACKRIKMMAGYRLSGTLAHLLALRQRQAIERIGADAVVGIPLHWSRRWRRGYDQGWHLAHQIGRWTEIPFRGEEIYRVRATPHQAGLSSTRRRQNVREAFAVRTKGSFKGQTVLLVDDILTTGSTCHHAAKALKQAGARRIVIAVLARTGQGTY